MRKPKIGVALGAGGARGLAQIIILEALDEMKIKPAVISGSSIGAIVGAFLAAGFSMEQLREIVDEIILGKRSKFWEIHKKSDFMKYFDFIDPTIRSGGLLKGNKLINFLTKKLKVSDFNDLQIPLKVVTTNYYSKKEEVLTDGKLMPAIRASYALPFLFAPIKINKHFLFDGGMVNPLPYDVLRGSCDIVLAIDVSATNPQREENTSPSSYEVLFSAFQIMQNSIVNEKLKLNKPDIHIKTNIKDVRVHEFLKTDEIYRQAEPSKKELQEKLEIVLSNFTKSKPSS